MRAAADAERQRKEYELRAPIHNVQVVVEEKNGHRSLAAAVETYLEEIKLTKKRKTHSSYSVALSLFRTSWNPAISPTWRTSNVSIC